MPEQSPPDLGMEAQPVRPAPFGITAYSPRAEPYGTPGKEAERIQVGGLEITLGTRPLALDLRQVYDSGHPDNPLDLPVYDDYEIWLIRHAVGVMATGKESVRALGYEAFFVEEGKVSTIDLIPSTRFKTVLDADTQFDLMAEGNFELPSTGVDLTPVQKLLGVARGSRRRPRRGSSAACRSA